MTNRCNTLRVAGACGQRRLGLILFGCGLLFASVGHGAAPVAAEPGAGVERIDDSRERQHDIEQLRALFLTGDFSVLEALLDTWVETRARTTSGQFRIEAFGLAMRTPKRADDEEWQEDLTRFAVWREASGDPERWPRLGEASYWVGYAWYARGGTTISGVQADKWVLFRDRIQRAEDLLAPRWDELKTLPCANYIRGAVAQAQGWPRERRDALAAEGIAAFPESYEVYHGKTAFLMARWHGSAKEEVAWAWDATEGQPEDDRLELYARLATAQRASYENVFQDPGYEWAKVRAGYDVMLRRWPKSGLVLNLYLRRAWEAEDWDVARGLARRPDFKPLTWVWGKRETWDAFKTWAKQPPDAVP